ALPCAAARTTATTCRSGTAGGRRDGNPSTGSNRPPRAPGAAVRPCRYGWRPGRSSWGSRDGAAGDADRQVFNTFYEARIYQFGWSDHLDIVEALEDFFPDDLELQLGEADADPRGEAERERTRP